MLIGNLQNRIGLPSRSERIRALARCSVFKLKVNQSAESVKPAKYPGTGCAMFVHFSSSRAEWLHHCGLASLHSRISRPRLAVDCSSGAPSERNSAWNAGVTYWCNKASSTTTIPTMTGYYNNDDDMTHCSTLLYTAHTIYTSLYFVLHSVIRVEHL